MLDHMSSLYFFSNEPPTTQIYPDGHTVSLHDALPISPGKAAALARFAGAAKAQAVARLPDDRRAATLVAFIRTLEASASDDVIDLFDAVSTKMFSTARINAKEARMRSLRDPDPASLPPPHVGGTVDKRR